MDLHSPKSSYQAGFSLVELSVVLAIIAVVIGSMLAMGIPAIEQARETQTRNKMAVIQRALLAFRQVNNRIPCPANRTTTMTTSTFGTEAGAAGNCSAGGVIDLGGNAKGGAVPVAVLGLPFDFTFDGWGRRFTYAVDMRLTGSNAFTTYPITDATVFSVTVELYPGFGRSNSLAYLLLSHGPNGHGGYLPTGAVKNAGSVNTYELNNCNCLASGAATTPDAVFIMPDRRPIINTGSPLDTFDDLSVFAGRANLRAEDE